VRHDAQNEDEIGVSRLKRRVTLYSSVRPSVKLIRETLNGTKYEVTQIRTQDVAERIEGFNLDELYENNSRVA
jgi:hypothetical protein